MQVGFIGAGKVGTALGYYFHKHNVEISGYYSRDLQDAIVASRCVEGRAYNTIDELVNQADIIFITTTDDQIEVVSEMLYQSETLGKDRLIIHTSGAHSSKIFGKLCDEGYNVGSMHPIQAFADFESALDQLPSTYFTIEGTEKALEWMKGLLTLTGNRFFQINEEQKALYHAGACVLSNYLVTLLDYGLSLFEAVGMDEKQVFEAMLPLIQGTLKNVEKKGTIEALTGPIVRGDGQTIERHLNGLEGAMPDGIHLYKILGQETLKMIENKRMTTEEINKNFSGNLVSKEEYNG